MTRAMLRAAKAVSVVREGGQELIPSGRIDRMILVIRGHKVMLDADLAELYGVTTSVLIQSVKRNLDRFPADFMFQLTARRPRL